MEKGKRYYDQESEDEDLSVGDISQEDFADAQRKLSELEARQKEGQEVTEIKSSHEQLSLLLESIDERLKKLQQETEELSHQRELLRLQLENSSDQSKNAA